MLCIVNIIALLLTFATNEVVNGEVISKSVAADTPVLWPATTEPQDLYRLPRHFLPTQYTLRLQPNMDVTHEGEHRRFQGLVTIRVTAQVVTDTITLHATEIEVEKVHVRRMQGDEEMEEDLMKDWETDKTHEFLNLHLTDDVEEGASYMITIEYSGILRDDMNGFYISTYKDKSKVKTILATMFQATQARKVFPCFDEPNFKARFLVSIDIPLDMKALSNMPVYAENRLVEYKTIIFENTMLMSTYLLNIIVFSFEFAEEIKPSEVVFKTWSRPHVLHWANYSLQVSSIMFDILQNYTEIIYSASTIRKIDQVALPNFTADAVGNLGLITYGERALLYNDASAAAKQYVATTIAHQLSSIWFGNLVTTDWWDTNWLCEGLARFFEYYVTDRLDSTWRMWDQFLVDQHQMALALDALPTAQALTHPISTPTQVRASFGSTARNKGSAVLRMLNYVVHPDNFHAALTRFLKENHLKNVKPFHLFAELKQYVNLPEEEFFELFQSWTEQPGFPVVTVQRDYELGIAEITQERFLLIGSKTEDYYIPLTWTREGGTFEIETPQIFLKPREKCISIRDMPSRNKWVLFNIQSTGYFRVNYDKHNWQMVISYLKNFNRPLDDVHRLNRAQLLDDAFNLARVGLLDYETAFELADYLPRETDYVPWASAITAFAYLDRMLVNSDEYHIFNRYMLRLIDKMYQTFEQDFPVAHERKLLFNLIVSWACTQNHQRCNEKARNDLMAYVNENKTIPSDLRSVIYCGGVRNVEDHYWNSMWQKYRESNDEGERALIVTGFACSNNVTRLTELLHHLRCEAVSKHDAISTYKAIYENPLGVDIALKFLGDNLSLLANKYWSLTSLCNIVSGLASHLTTTQQITKLKTIIDAHEEKLKICADEAINLTKINLLWIVKYRKSTFNILRENEMKMYRLKTSVLPHHYTLKIEPIFSKNLLLGNVTIQVTAQEASDTITLQSNGINTISISVLDMSKVELYRSHSYESHLEILRIYLKSQMTLRNPYVIEIQYIGSLRKDMKGFYVSSYKDTDGKESTIAATHFQPTYARRAFPCFDETKYKSTFEVTIKSPPLYRATLGNTPALYTRVWSDLSMERTFRTTPKMSTNVLAIVVADFPFMENDEGDVTFRTWVRSGVLHWANYSMVVSRDILEQLEEYTGIPYTDPTLDSPMTKVDQVALPDFAAGAMENWGLVTYRETALLYNDGTASARKSVATIIAHELAHMWFGNLVTTDWWDATWLNEGFAQYFQYFITDKVKPSWRLMDQFLVDHHQAVFASDSLSTSVALTYPAYTPAQVMSRFSGITYSKGASILRMISAIIGEEHFRSALHEYLKEHSYETTKPEDLFAKLLDKFNEAGLEENEFTLLLESWTKQPGFPVVTINRANENGEVTISQKRFILKDPESEDETLYYIPLTWAKEGDDFATRLPQKYITSSEKQITVNTGVESGTWVIFNVQETGFYRVNYDEENWKLITDYLKDSTKSLSGIHVLNRAQLLDDAFNLARAGLLSYDTAVDVSDYLYRETDYIPWASAFSAFSYLQRMLHHEERYNYFEKYTLRLLEHLYEYYQFEDQEHHIEKLLLNRVLAWACSLQMESCINSASTALDDHMNNNRVVPADLRSVVYCYGIRHSPTEYWDKMWDKYRNTKDNAERAIIMAGLACSHDESKLEQLLRSSIDGTIRKQDASSVFTAVYGNTVGVDVALDFLDNNFEDVQESYGSMGAINNIVIGISGRLTTEEQELKMKSFVDRHRDSLGATADNALETVQENLQWLKEYADAILDVLEKRVTSAVTTTSSSAGTTSSSEGTTTISEGTTTSSAGTIPTTTPNITTTPIIPTTNDALKTKISLLLVFVLFLKSFFLFFM